VKKSLRWMAAAALALASFGCGAGTDPVAPASQIDSAPPQAPVGLVQTLNASNQRIVQWTANSESDLGGYQVYQYLPDPARDNAYDLVATLPASQTNWALPVVDHPTTGWVRLRAVDQAGNRSAVSAKLQVVLLPTLPGAEAPPEDTPPIRH
jgi:hypothetical protein